MAESRKSKLHFAVIRHPDIYEKDYPEIYRDCDSEQMAIERRELINRHIDEIKADKGVRREPLKRTLSGWWSKHVNTAPQEHKADLRIVYRFDFEREELQILAIGWRREDPMVYKTAGKRLTGGSWFDDLP